jgi:porphobilinogen deaminase
VPGGILAILILPDTRYIAGIGSTEMEPATSVLSVDEMLPEVAQGAIRISCRNNDGKMDGI